MSITLVKRPKALWSISSKDLIYNGREVTVYPCRDFWFTTYPDL